MSIMPTRSMKSFACGDVVPGCSRTFLGSEDADILALVAGHAVADHDLVEVPSELLAAVRSRIVAVG